MPFFTVQEIIDIVLMTVIVGFIFSDVFRRPSDDPLSKYKPGKKQNIISRFNLENFKYAILLVAPAIILHELGHKFVAMAFGLHATFHAAYTWLGLGVVLKLIGFPYVFFVPAYVSFTGATSPMQVALIAFAGPGINLLLWLISIVVLKTSKLTQKQTMLFTLSKQVNLFLFIFNMLPFWLFDGAKVFSGLSQMF